MKGKGREGFRRYLVVFPQGSYVMREGMRAMTMALSALEEQPLDCVIDN
jgi:hypothetical protein